LKGKAGGAATIAILPSILRLGSYILSVMSRTSFSALSFLFAMALFSSGASAIPFADRTIVPDPFDERVEGPGGFLYGSSGWGEFSYFAAASDEDHSWDARLGARVGLYRIGNSLSLDAASEIELVSSPNNEIRLKPRAFFWQESLFAMRRDGALDWGLGYYHRCRHDVDNLYEEGAFGEELERIGIWDSLSLRLYPRPLAWSWGGGFASLRLTADWHHYVLSQDCIPDRYAGRDLSLNDLADTLALGLILEPYRRGDLGFSIALKEYTDLYRKGDELSLAADYTAEAALVLYGPRSSLSAFIRYERFAETLMDPWRQKGDYLLIGLRLM